MILSITEIRREKLIRSDVFDRNVPKAGCLTFQTITSSFRSHWHSHQEFEIVYIQDGKGAIQYGNTLFEYEQGSLFLLGPWIPHEFRENSANHKSASILFTDHFLSIDLFECETSTQIKKIFKDSIFGLYFSIPKREQIDKSIQTIMNTRGIDKSIQLFFLLKQIKDHPHHKLQEILPKNQENTRFYKKYTQLQDILLYINNQLSNDVSLQSVANQFYVSKSYLSQLFNDFIQTTFNDYLLNQRLYYACRLLATSDKSITEISEQVGFGTQSSFNRNFLKRKGVSPREYRKRTSILS